MSVCGKWVKTFAEASHALPLGMSMNADYPFMLPRIVSTTAKQVTIEGRGGKKATRKIQSDGNGEYFTLAQMSTYEKLFGRKRGSSFRFCPFKDDETEVPAEPAS